jgi:hypothetical protein
MIYYREKEDVERLNEKAMFTNVSWGNYLIAISILLLIWYLILAFKLYLSELKQIFKGEKKINFLSFGSRSKKSADGNLKPSFSESFDTLQDAEELSDRILTAIEESNARKLNKEEFKNYLKLLFNDYPFVKISSLRENINNLIVSECIKHPQLLLTYGEVEGLWEETL